MIGNPVLSYSILLITAGMLFYAALTDLKQFHIPNELVVVLGGLFFVYALQSGQWAAIPWHVGFALAISLAMLFFYASGWVGGGDVKILAVALLWAGVDCALAFAVLLLIFTSAHAGAAKLGWAAAQQDADGRQQRIPFAPSVAAALIGTFMLGCLQPLP
jgi:prepilin peptidase CpaA